MSLPQRPPMRLRDAAARAYVRYSPIQAGKAELAARLIASYRTLPRNVLARTSTGTFHTRTDDLLQGYLYLFGVWEPHITAWLMRTLRPADTFIDVGANVGYYSLLASRLVGGAGHVVAVEASPDFSRLVAAHAHLNDCRNLRVVNVAASDHDGVATFFQPCRYNLGHTTQHPEEPGLTPVFTVECRPLPSVLTPSEIAQARVIKLDVEGGEQAVLTGLLPVIGCFREDAELLVEIDPDGLARQGLSADQLIAQMDVLGFHAYRVANGYCIPDYLEARRAQSDSGPRRLTDALTSLADVVFSRRDVMSL